MKVTRFLAILLMAVAMFFGLGFALAQNLDSNGMPFPIGTLSVTLEPVSVPGPSYPTGANDAKVPGFGFMADAVEDIEVRQMSVHLNGDLQYFQDLKFWIKDYVVSAPYDNLNPDMTVEINFVAPRMEYKSVIPTVDIADNAPKGVKISIDILNVVARGLSYDLEVPVLGLPAIGSPITVEPVGIVLVGDRTSPSTIQIGQTVNLFNLDFQVEGGTVAIYRVVLFVDGDAPEKDLMFLRVNIGELGIAMAVTKGKMDFTFPAIFKNADENFQVSVETFPQDGSGHGFSISFTELDASDDAGNLVPVEGLPHTGQWQIAGEPEPVPPTLTLSVNGDKFSPGDAISGLISFTAGSETFSGECELWRQDPPSPIFPNGRWMFVGKWPIVLNPGVGTVIIYQTIAPTKIKPGTYDYGFVAVLWDKKGNEATSDAESWDLVVPERRKK